MADERVVIGNNDGSDPFGDQSSSTVSSVNAPSTKVNKNDAGNMPFEFTTPIGLDQVPVSSGDGIFRNVDVASLTLGNSGDANLGNVKFISEKADLPAPVGGVITLLPDIVYYFTASVDLTGDRFVASQNTCILGASSENAFITSTGLPVATPLLYTEYTIPIRHVSFKDVNMAIWLNGNPIGGMAVDWTGVNFINIPNIGIVDNVDNFIFDKGTFISSNKLEFDGNIGTVAINNSLLTTGSGDAGQYIIGLEAGLVISRRFRITYSSVVAFGGSSAIKLYTGANIPVEGLILDTMNFAGGGNYLDGFTNTSAIARFIQNRGVSNSSPVGGMAFHANTIQTPIASAQVEVSIEGVTAPYSLNQQFTHTPNVLTYIGALDRGFEVSASLSLRCPSRSNRQVGVYVVKNGVKIDESEIYMRTSNTSDMVNGTVLYALELSTNDSVEIWVENADSADNILVENFNCLVKPITN